MKVAVAGLVVIAMLAVPSVAASAGKRESLPPSGRKALASIFDEKVEELGLRVTRAALVNPRQRRDPKGTHLAIYVEPTGEYTPQDYVDGTVDVTQVFLPYVFERWKRLKSFDVCQEPKPSVDDRKTPQPETQVFATRRGSRAIDWSTVDVSTMIEHAEAAEEDAGSRPVRFSFFVAQHLQNTPAYQDAAGAAATTTPSAPAAREYG